MTERRTAVTPLRSQSVAAMERTALPALSGYYQRLVERPAFRDHVMVSYEELRA